VSENKKLAIFLTACLVGGAIVLIQAGCTSQSPADSAREVMEARCYRAERCDGPSFYKDFGSAGIQGCVDHSLPYVPTPDADPAACVDWLWNAPCTDGYKGAACAAWMP